MFSGLKSCEICPIISPTLNSLHHQKFIKFQVCFQGEKKQKSGYRPWNSLKNDFREESIFAIPSLRKPRFGSPKRRNFDSEIDKNMTWKQAPNKNDILSFMNSEREYTQVPESAQHQIRSCKLPFQINPAAPAVLQRGPEVPQWSYGRM